MTDKILKDQVVLELDVPNANNRVYPTAVGNAMVEQFKKRSHSGNSVLGELGYPTENFGSIDLNRVSHHITDLRVEDGKLLANVTILETPMGKLVNDAILSTCKFRPRGFGTVSPRDDGTFELSDYSLVTIDLVDNAA